MVIETHENISADEVDINFCVEGSSSEKSSTFSCLQISARIAVLLFVVLFYLFLESPMKIDQNNVLIKQFNSNIRSIHIGARGLSTQEEWVSIVPKQKSQDFCASQYTKEKLIGRCWGLTTSTEHPSVKGTIRDKIIITAKECQQLCCDLGDICITWQFWADTLICKIGKHVRVGKEGGNTALWCEPLPPQKWNGGKLNPMIPLSQRKSETECNYLELLPGQCFGLGPEKLNSTNGKLSAEDCASRCCKSQNCILWQHLPERGCFYNTDRMKKYPHCDQYKGVYIGGRKKISQFHE